MTFIFIILMFTVVMFISAGILFFIAQGNLRRLEQAKGFFTWGVVGVVLVILTYLVEVIIKSL